MLVSDLLNSLDKKSEENVGKYLDRDFDEVSESYFVEFVIAFSLLQMLLSAETKLSDGMNIPLNYQAPTVKWDAEP